MVLDFLMLSVVIVYSGFAGLQWREIRASGGDTKNLADAAGKQANAITRLVDATEELARANRRAVVTASLLGTNPPAPGSGFTPGNPSLTARIQIENFGPTPAQIHSFLIRAEAIPRDHKPAFGTGLPVEMKTLLGYGKTVTRVPFLHASGEENGPVSAQLVREMTSGLTRLVVHGQVQYSDVYGACRVSSFCSEYIYRPPADAEPPEWFQCLEHNGFADCTR